MRFETDAIHAGQEPDQRLENPSWHIHAGAVPEIRADLTFAVLLNRVPVNAAPAAPQEVTSPETLPPEAAAAIAVIRVTRGGLGTISGKKMMIAGTHVTNGMLPVSAHSIQGVITARIRHRVIS